MSDKSCDSSLSRRGFLKGIGVGSVAGGLISPLSVRAAEANGTKGPGDIPITLQINGDVLFGGDALLEITAPTLEYVMPGNNGIFVAPGLAHHE